MMGMWGWRCGAVGPGFTFGVVGQDEEGMWGDGDVGLEMWSWRCGAGAVGQALWGRVLPSEWWDRMRRLTQAAPAPDPKMVMRCGSPPKCPTFSLSHRSAWIWSSRP